MTAENLPHYENAEDHVFAAPRSGRVPTPRRFEVEALKAADSQQAYPCAAWRHWQQQGPTRRTVLDDAVHSPYVAYHHRGGRIEWYEEDKPKPQWEGRPRSAPLKKTRVWVERRRVDVWAQTRGMADYSGERSAKVKALAKQYGVSTSMIYRDRRVCSDPLWWYWRGATLPKIAREFGLAKVDELRDEGWVAQRRATKDWKPYERPERATLARFAPERFESMAADDDTESDVVEGRKRQVPTPERTLRWTPNGAAAPADDPYEVGDPSQWDGSLDDVADAWELVGGDVRGGGA